MTEPSDSAYYEARRRQELAAALKSPNRSAQLTHLQLADAYQALLTKPPRAVK